MKLLVDMNLSPEWVEVLEKHGWESCHWSAVGNPRAVDTVVMAYARDNGYVLFTHDLDFGNLLAVTNVSGPSVIQVRTQDVSPEHLEPLLVAALHQFETELETGALIVVDEARLRARILPLNIPK